MATKSHAYKNVVLGFLEPATNETSVASNFASKAGGLPVWLYREPKAPPKVRRCSNCSQPERFLLQVYAPIEKEDVGHDQAFHRALYVSVCQNSTCLSGCSGVSVVRAQLPRRNAFYPFNADDDGSGRCGDDGRKRDYESSTTLACSLCGYLGDLQCSKCHCARYCSKRCQKDDWVCGHRAQCLKMSNKETEDAEEILDITLPPVGENREKWRLPEMEIVTDRHRTPPQSESDDEDDEDNEDNKNNEDDKNNNDGVDNDDNGNIGDNNFDERGKQDEREADSGVCKKDIESTNISCGVIPRGSLQDADEEELPEELFVGSRSENMSDKVAEKFTRIISYDPEQVIRYERGGRPLWGGRNGQCNLPDIRVCERCGAQRIFELQIMAQLVYLLQRHGRESGTDEGDSNHRDCREGLESIARRLRDDADWTTIVVMTCSKSCSLEEGSYAEECAWVQREL